MNETADQIAAAIASLQAQRATLGDVATDLAVASLRERQEALQSWPGRSSAPTTADTDPQLRLATVLFVDVVGSTTIGGRLDPEDIQLVMDGALRRLSAVVGAHDGRVLQYAGDSLLAVFGADHAREADPENAVRAGLAILEEARHLALELKQSHRIEGFAVRAGAHTGPVLLGGGVDGEHSVRGSTVNIAARMEQTAAPGTFRISRDCHQHVRGLFDVAKQAPLAVKGMDRKLVTFLVHGVSERTFRPSGRGVGGITTRMIDRANEAEHLRDAYRSLCSVEQRGPAMLLLVGEAGIGKTRLQSEFEDWADRQPRGACAMTARASERRMGQPYGLLRDLLTSHTAIQDSDTAALSRAKWLAATEPRLGSNANAAVLGHLLGLDFSDHEGVKGIAEEARQIRDLGFHYASELLRDLSATGPPLLLLLDDLQWADDGSLDFVDHLLATHGDAPLLLVGLARPSFLERRPSWESASDRLTRIELPQLDARYSEELVAVLLQRLTEAPRELRDLIVERAEGNAYYMEELVNMLIDQGVIVPGETWQLRPASLAGAELPTTLTGVLQARLDELPHELRRALHLAAVIGHVFWDAALAELDVRPDSVLPGLIARHLIVSRENSTLGGMQEYAFGHQALHHVCYSSVLKRQKQAAHARVARWLEAQQGMAHLDLIAEHFERGGDVPTAISYWQRAAEEAAVRYANATALKHASRGLALISPGDLERRYALNLLMAKVLRLLSERPRLALCLDELVALADRIGNDALRSEAAERLARFFDEGGEVAQALNVARQALALAPTDAPECSARAHLLIASTLCTLGRPDEALPHANAGMAAAREAGNPAVEAMILNQMGMDANNRGDPGRAIALFEQALMHHREARNRSNEAATLSNMAYAAFVLGDYESAYLQFLQAAELCRQIGQRQSEGIVQINLALVLLCRGEAGSAREIGGSALQLLRLAGDRLGQAAALRVAGHAELALGGHEAASGYFAESRALFEEIGLEHLAIEAIAGQALHALACQDTAGALAYVETILTRQAVGASLAGTDEPLRIGLVCYQVLVAAADTRAHALLMASYAELQSRAAKITDPAQRDGFMQHVPWHRELRRLWAQWSGT